MNEVFYSAFVFAAWLLLVLALWVARQGEGSAAARSKPLTKFDRWSRAAALIAIVNVTPFVRSCDYDGTSDTFGFPLPFLEYGPGPELAGFVPWALALDVLLLAVLLLRVLPERTNRALASGAFLAWCAILAGLLGYVLSPLLFILNGLFRLLVEWSLPEKFARSHAWDDIAARLTWLAILTPFFLYARKAVSRREGPSRSP
ncbi:MAG TPA: hypothetical protein VLC09_13715 [Polyangiaceae bacterium]|nr:hypothetical protein [Polyangiaceae bacterium]